MFVSASVNMILKASGRVCQSCGARYMAAPPRRVQARAAAQPPVSPNVMQRLAELRQQDPAQQADDFDDFDDFDAPAAPSSAPSEQQQGDEEAGVPQPRDTKVHAAKYVSSSVSLSSCPPPKAAEFAVIGRSNVGKSSLINMLVRDSKLAMTSKQPGKTKCINHFLINDAWWLVDLPGYGYAKRGREDRLAWNTFTKEYFLERETLVMVLLLVDGSIPTQAVDVECAVWLAEADVPFCVVFTKVDKRKKKGPSCADNMDAFCQALAASLGDVPDCFVTSSSEGKGRTALMQHLSVLRQVFESDPDPALD